MATAVSDHVGGPQTKPTSTSPAAPKRYSGFDAQYIGGAWRPGKQRTNRVDTDPFSGETLVEIPMANTTDLDEAYQAAAKAQIAWAGLMPSERAAIMLSSLAIMEARRDEIVDWLISESGSTVYKAQLEWQYLHAITREAATFPYRVNGHILPIDEP